MILYKYFAKIRDCVFSWAFSTSRTSFSADQDFSRLFEFLLSPLRSLYNLRHIFQGFAHALHLAAKNSTLQTWPDPEVSARIKVLGPHSRASYDNSYLYFASIREPLETQRTIYTDIDHVKLWQFKTQNCAEQKSGPVFSIWTGVAIWIDSYGVSYWSPVFPMFACFFLFCLDLFPWTRLATDPGGIFLLNSFQAVYNILDMICKVITSVLTGNMQLPSSASSFYLWRHGRGGSSCQATISRVSTGEVSRKNSKQDT